MEVFTQFALAQFHGLIKIVYDPTIREQYSIYQYQSDQENMNYDYNKYHTITPEQLYN